MNLSRRSFLKSSGLLASGLSLGGLSLLKASEATGQGGVSAFGLQLYTLRDVIVGDPKGVLKKVAEFGYQQIESYEGPQGIFWGMSNTEFKRYIDDLGMTIVSSHANVFDNYERKVAQAAEIGLKYIVCPWIGRQNSLDDYRRMAERFNGLGQIAKEAGIKFAYHNHGYTFEEQDGEMPQDILMRETEADLVDFQVDIYWVEITGQSTVDWINKYPGRFTTCHVKDMTKGERPESTILGTGVIDFPTILSVARKDGMKYFIVEQEAYAGTTSLDAVRENANYMKKLELTA